MLVCALNTIHSAHVKRKLPLSLFRAGGGGRRRLRRNFQRLIVVVASIAFQFLFYGANVKRNDSQKMTKDEREQTENRNRTMMHFTTRTSYAGRNGALAGIMKQSSAMQL